MFGNPKYLNIYDENEYYILRRQKWSVFLQKERKTVVIVNIRKTLTNAVLSATLSIPS